MGGGKGTTMNARKHSKNKIGEICNDNNRRVREHANSKHGIKNKFDPKTICVHIQI